MPRSFQVIIATLIAAATLASCDNDTSPKRATSPSAPSPEAGAALTIDPVGTTVYRDSVGVAAFVRNPGAQGVRDIELSIELFAGTRRVVTISDVLAFCPAGATCPWGTAFGVTDRSHRSIDSAKVTIVRTGPTFGDGVLRPIDLQLDAGSLTFEQPTPRGVVILYVLEDEAPIFGMFRVHQMVGPETVHLTEDTLPIGPGTRAVFYEGHVPESMIAGGD